MIRPSTREIICTALEASRTYDERPMSEHVHLLSVTSQIVRGFAAEGIDLEALIEEALAAQSVSVDGQLLLDGSER